MSIENKPESILDQPITRRGFFGLAFRAVGAAAVGSGALVIGSIPPDEPKKTEQATPQPRMRNLRQPLYGTTVGNEIIDSKAKTQVSYEGAVKFLTGIALGILGTASFGYGRFLDSQKPIARITERRIENGNHVDDIPPNLTLDQILAQTREHTPKTLFPNKRIRYTTPPPIEIDETKVPRIITRN